MKWQFVGVVDKPHTKWRDCFHTWGVTPQERFTATYPTSKSSFLWKVTENNQEYYALSTHARARGRYLICTFHVLTIADVKKIAKISNITKTVSIVKHIIPSQTIQCPFCNETFECKEELSFANRPLLRIVNPCEHTSVFAFLAAETGKYDVFFRKTQNVVI